MTENEALEDIIKSGINLGAGDYVDLEALKVAAKSLQEIQQYRSIGTVEECREAVERQKASSYHNVKNGVPICDKCGGIMDLLQGELNYCPNCGQRLE